MLEAVEEDLENRLDIFNASTVCCYFLVQLLTRGAEGKTKAPTVNALKRKIQAGLQLGGYWKSPPPCGGMIVPARRTVGVGHGHTTWSPNSYEQKHGLGVKYSSTSLYDTAATNYIRLAKKHGDLRRKAYWGVPISNLFRVTDWVYMMSEG
jgi:hypothetical protein